MNLDLFILFFRLAVGLCSVTMAVVIFSFTSPDTPIISLSLSACFSIKYLLSSSMVWYSKNRVFGSEPNVFSSWFVICIVITESMPYSSIEMLESIFWTGNLMFSESSFFKNSEVLSRSSESEISFADSAVVFAGNVCLETSAALFSEVFCKRRPSFLSEP